MIADPEPESPKRRKGQPARAVKPRVADAGLTPVSPERASDPVAYLELSQAISEKAFQGLLDPVDAKRLKEVVRNDCLEMTGMSLKDIAAERQNPIDQAMRLRNLAEATEQHLNALEEAMRQVDEGRTGVEKKRWTDLIRRTIAIQRDCRADPAKFMVYCLRDADPVRAGEVLRMKPFHVAYFDVWNDPQSRNSLVMAPPGHGKTTCLRAQIIWEIGHTPELRCLLVYDKEDKARKECRTIKLLMRSRPYRAIFPDVRVLGRAEGEQDSGLRFTVGRKNWFSRDPTVEAVGIKANVNGDGYDRIYGDDFSSPRVAHEQYLRNEICQIWDEVIEERRRDPERSRMRIIHTPWHPDDKVGKIRAGVTCGQLRDWRVEADRFGIKDDEKGEAIPLWPEKFSRQHYREEKFKLGAKYEHIHRLRARADSQRILTRVWWYNSTNNFLTENDKKVHEALQSAEWWLSIDPAGSLGPSSSSQGVVEVALLSNRYALFTNVWFLQKSAPDMMDWIVDRVIFRWRKKQRYQGLMIEAQGGIKGQVSMWERYIPREALAKSANRDQHDNVIPGSGMRQAELPLIWAPGTRIGSMSINRGKLKRLIEASPYIEAGYVRFAGQRVTDRIAQQVRGQVGTRVMRIKNSPMARLEDYLLNFDGTNNADAVDATSQWILVMKDRLPLPGQAPPAPGNEQPAPVDEMTAAFREQMKLAEEPKDRRSGAAEELEFLHAKYGSGPLRRQVA